MIRNFPSRPRSGGVGGKFIRSPPHQLWREYDFLTGSPSFLGGSHSEIIGSSRGLNPTQPPRRGRRPRRPEIFRPTPFTGVRTENLLTFTPNRVLDDRKGRPYSLNGRRWQLFFNHRKAIPQFIIQNSELPTHSQFSIQKSPRKPAAQPVSGGICHL